MSEDLVGPQTRAPRAGRIPSIDVLRGFDMFWIVGGEHLVRAFEKMGSNPLTRQLVNQLKHRTWDGFVFYDLIFHLFIFIVGVSIVLSLTKMLALHGRRAAYVRIFKRFIILYLLGLFYYKGIAGGFEGVRLMGVLQRIAICYFAAALLFCHFSWRPLLALAVLILLGYWALFTFVPVPDLGFTTFDMQANWGAYVDKLYLPLYKIYGTWDPEGLISNLPAIATCLLGICAGAFLLNPDVAPLRKGIILMGIGVLLAVAGYLWGLQFPIIKKIWTSSFVFVAGGYSFLLLGLFYLIVDVWNVRWWTPPFMWIGSNALVLYMIDNVVEFESLSQRIVGGPIQARLGGAGDLLVSATSVLFILLIARFLYVRKIFIKL